MSEDNVTPLHGHGKPPPQSLLTDKKGRPIACAYNANTILATDPALSELFARDSLAGREVLKKALPPEISQLTPQPGPYPRPWTTPDIALVQGYLHRKYNNKFGFQIVENAMLVAAAANQYHPVIDWLDTLVWDEKPRIDTWLISAFNAVDTPYVRAIGAKFLVAGIRRILHPGCQFDHMLVLEGPQDIGKSRCCRTLFGNDWFTDDVPHDLSNKDAPFSLLGVWGAELGEVAQITGRRSEIETIKAFLSRRVDRFRPPYGRGFVIQPRQMVFIGSTNRQDWLSADDTGNRRFWPVYCETADFSWIAVNRDQLWAEATVREARGDPIFLDSCDLKTQAHIQQEGRREDDPWKTRIAAFVVGKTTCQIPDILDHLNVRVEHQDKAIQMRCARLLREEGWVKLVSWDQKRQKTVKVWKPL